MATAQEEAASAPLVTRTPNLYLLRAAQLHIAYSTTSFDGRPRLDYQDASQTLVFEGGQIRTVTTEIGTLVTVTIAITVDRFSVELSLTQGQTELYAITPLTGTASFVDF